MIDVRQYTFLILKNNTKTSSFYIENIQKKENKPKINTI